MIFIVFEYDKENKRDKKILYKIKSIHFNIASILIQLHIERKWEEVHLFNRTPLQ